MLTAEKVVAQAQDVLDTISYTKALKLLQLAVDHHATDIHLVVNRPPIFRINGEITVSNNPPFSSADVREIIFDMMTPEQKAAFLENLDIDLSYLGIKDFYFRVNAHIEKGNLAANIRILPTHMGSGEELGLPAAVAQMARKRKGLIMLVGPAGSGKTTTMNYMVDLINQERRCKIVMIEDPIEYVHESKKSLIIQREVGNHTKSFATALKHALRQDPDVVVVGEMRDPESIAMALTTAETGHLVLTTLHAPDTIESINRIIDVCPSDKQNQVRMQLAENLVGIIGQLIIPLQNGTGRVLATEVLTANLPIRNIIRRGSLLEVRGQMVTGEEGMYTFEQCLCGLVDKGVLTRDYAKQYAKFPNLL